MTDAPASGSSDTRATGPATGTELDVEISNVAHGGIFVARHEGRVIFVPDVLPGETARIRVSDDSHASFWRGEALEILEPSEHRQPHIWAEAGIDRAPGDRPGGAEFGHTTLENQRELKRAVLRDSFSRFAKQDIDVEVEPVAGGETADGGGWRTRVRLHVDASGRVGPFAARSHDVVDVETLPLATEAVRGAAPLGRRAEPGSTIDLVDAADSDGAMIVSTSEGERPRSSRVVTEFVGDRPFQVDQLGFWQVHRGAAKTLFDATREAIDADRFDSSAPNHDLYGGVGLLAAAMADRFGRTVGVTTVESDSRATDHAAENLAEWIGARAITARVDRYLDDVLAGGSGAGASRGRGRAAGAGGGGRGRGGRGERRGAGGTSTAAGAGVAADARRGLPARRGAWAGATVVIDPPRAGAGAKVVRGLATLAPAQIVYVACDPVALARDVATFAGLGYRVDLLRAFDLFPNTHHVEAIARLVPESGAAHA